MGRRTLAANMEDAYDDCAGRERGMYIRDTVIQYYVNLATFGDRSLIQRSLELFGQSLDPAGRFRIIYPNTGMYTSNDFALNMVEGYRASYEHTGDTDRIKKDWSAIEVTSDGSVSSPMSGRICCSRLGKCWAASRTIRIPRVEGSTQKE